MCKRIDIHSPSNIIPSDYNYIMSFYNGAGKFIFPVNNRAVVELRLNRKGDFANIHGGNYDCDICGSSYNEGEVWEHVETKELITLGHICAGKMGLIAVDEPFKRQKASYILKEKRLIERRVIRQNMKEVLKENDGLGDALRVKHHIIENLRENFIKWGKLSEKQIKLAFKLKVQVEGSTEINFIDAPDTDDRISVSGKVMSTKDVANYYGYNESWITKGMIFIETDVGVWKTWGTISDKVLMKIDEEGRMVLNEVIGKTVKFTARFKRDRNDKSMTFFSRPTKMKLVEV